MWVESNHLESRSHSKRVLGLGARPQTHRTPAAPLRIPRIHASRCLGEQRTYKGPAAGNRTARGKKTQETKHTETLGIQGRGFRVARVYCWLLLARPSCPSLLEYFRNPSSQNGNQILGRVRPRQSLHSPCASRAIQAAGHRRCFSPKKPMLPSIM